MLEILEKIVIIAIIIYLTIKNVFLGLLAVFLYFWFFSSKSQEGLTDPVPYSIQIGTHTIGSGTINLSQESLNNPVPYTIQIGTQSIGSGTIDLESIKQTMTPKESKTLPFGKTESAQNFNPTLLDLKNTTQCFS